MRNCWQKIFTIISLFIVVQLIFYLNHGQTILNKSESEKIVQDINPNDFEINVFKTDFPKETNTKINKNHKVFIESHSNEIFFDYKPFILKSLDKSYDFQRARKIDKKTFKIVEYTKIGKLYHHYNLHVTRLKINFVAINLIINRISNILLNKPYSLKNEYYNHYYNLFPCSLIIPIL